jgi:hypothetical protein
MNAPILTAAADRLSPTEIVNVALRDNALIKAARAKWEMMKARVPQARAWEDLRAGVDSVATRSVSIPPNSFMDQTAMLEQEVPVSGKNLSRARAATARDVVDKIYAGYPFEILAQIIRVHGDHFCDSGQGELFACVFVDILARFPNRDWLSSIPRSGVFDFSSRRHLYHPPATT